MDNVLQDRWTYTAYDEFKNCFSEHHDSKQLYCKIIIEETMKGVKQTHRDDYKDCTRIQSY
jgi:hypothetical protein